MESPLQVKFFGQFPPPITREHKAQSLYISIFFPIMQYKYSFNKTCYIALKKPRASPNLRIRTTEVGDGKFTRIF